MINNSKTTLFTLFDERLIRLIVYKGGNLDIPYYTKFTLEVLDIFKNELVMDIDLIGNELYVRLLLVHDSRFKGWCYLSNINFKYSTLKILKYIFELMSENKSYIYINRELISIIKYIANKWKYKLIVKDVEPFFFIKKIELSLLDIYDTFTETT